MVKESVLKESVLEKSVEKAVLEESVLEKAVLEESVPEEPELGKNAMGKHASAGGAAPIRWRAEDGPLRIDSGLTDWSGCRTLQLELESAAKTCARIRLDVLGPDGAAIGGVTFAADWKGTNRMELCLHSLEPRETPPVGRWTRVGALRLACETPGLWPTEMAIRSWRLLERVPLWPVSDSDTLIDIEWHPALRTDDWLIDERLSDFPAGGVNAGRSVDSGKRVFGYVQGDRPGALFVARRFDLKLHGNERLLGKVKWDPDTAMKLTAVVDGGREIVLFDSEAGPVEGAGDWVTVGGALQGAKRLDSVALAIREKEARLVSGREIGTGLWWLLLRRPSEADDAPLEPVTVQLAGEWTPFPEHPPTRTRMVRRISFEERESTSPIGDPLADGLPFGFYIGKHNLGSVRRSALEGETRHVFERLRREVDRVVRSDRVDRNLYGSAYMGAVGRPIGYCGAGINIFAPIAAAAHLITGEARYAVAARRWILRAARSPEWTGEHYGLVGRAEEGEVAGHESFTETMRGFLVGFFQAADISRGVALAYDMLYHCFNPQERDEVERALADLGFPRLYDKLRFNRDRWIASNIGLAFAEPLLMTTAFLKDKDPVYADVHQWTMEFLREFGQRVWNGEGVCGEAPGYGINTAATYVASLFAIAACEGKDVREIAPAAHRLVWKYGLHCRSTWWTDRPRYVTFGDTFEQNWIHPSLLAFSASVYRDGEAKYMLEERDEDVPSTRLALLLLAAPQVEAKKPSLAPAHVYVDQPLAFMRTGWERGDTLLAMTAMRYTAHTHFDRGSVVLEYGGEQLLLDPGMVSYNSPSSHQLRGTQSHNALTLSGSGQKHVPPAGPGEQRPAGIVGFLSTSGDRCPGEPGGVDWVIADVTEAYPQALKVVRHVLFLRPGLAVLYDEVSTAAPETMELNWICAGPLRREEERFVSTAERNRLLLHTQADKPLSFQAHPWFSAWPNLRPSRLVASTAARETACSFLTVLAPCAVEARPASIEPIRVEGGLGVRVVWGGHDDSVYCRGSVAGLAAEGVESDARMAVVRRRAGRLAGLALLDGTYLAVPGGKLELARPGFAGMLAGRGDGQGDGRESGGRVIEAAISPWKI